MTLVESIGFMWHILRLPVAFFQHRWIGDLVSRATSTARVARLISGELATTTVSLLTLVVYVAVMLPRDPLLAAVGVGISSLNLVAIQWLGRWRADRNRSIEQIRGRLLAGVMGAIQMIESVKAAGSESDLLVRWSGDQARMINAEQALGFWDNLLLALPPALASLTAVTVLGLGGREVIDGGLSIGVLVAFQSLLAYFNQPFRDMARLGTDVQELRADLDRIDDVRNRPIDTVFSTASSARSRPEPRWRSRCRIRAEPRRLSGHIEFRARHVRLQPDGRGTFDQGFLIRRPPWPAHRARRQLRKRKIDDRPAGRRAVPAVERRDPLRRQARQRAAARGLRQHRRAGRLRHLSVRGLGPREPDALGRDGSVGPGHPGRRSTRRSTATCSSAGAAIARSSASRDGTSPAASASGCKSPGPWCVIPACLILDEATSALDPKTEMIVDDNLRRRGCTCLIIAHRLTTIRDCDEIIVLSGGRVVQRGTHDELFADQPGRVRAPGIASGVARPAIRSVFPDASQSGALACAIRDHAVSGRRERRDRRAGRAPAALESPVAFRDQGCRPGAVHRRGADALQPAGADGRQSAAGARRSGGRLVGILRKRRRLLHSVRARRDRRADGVICAGSRKGVRSSRSAEYAVERGAACWPSAPGLLSS